MLRPKPIVAIAIVPHATHQVADAAGGPGLLQKLGRLLKEKAAGDFDRFFQGTTKTRERLGVSKPAGPVSLPNAGGGGVGAAAAHGGLRRGLACAAGSTCTPIGAAMQRGESAQSKI